MAQSNSDITAAVFKMVSYNLRGLNSGRGLLSTLCNDPEIAIIAVQEHWLTPNNLHLLNTVHPEFVGFGISAMNKKLDSGIYSGRPFGGVGFLWRKCFSKLIRVINGDDNGRCLCISIDRIGSSPLKLINVYFPCQSSNFQYTVELGNCLGYIENVMLPSEDVIIMGDMNFTCTADNAGFLQCKNVLDRFSIAHCDDFCLAPNTATYVNDSLKTASFIDHYFISNSIRLNLNKIVIIDSGANLRLTGLELGSAYLPCQCVIQCASGPLPP